MQIKIILSSLHAAGSQIKSHRPQNISGASQQNKLAAFCNKEEEEEEEEEDEEELVSLRIFLKFPD